MIRRNLLAALTNPAADTTPLRKIVTRYVNKQVIEAIPAEYRKRRHYDRTVNLDASGRSSGTLRQIASSGRPEALSVDPQRHSGLRIHTGGIFTGLYRGGETGGKRYDELHVDGGTASQVFLPLPPSTSKLCSGASM